MDKVLFAWSGGKDSAISLYEIRKSEKYEIVALLTTITDGYDRVSMHGVPRTLVEQQAYSLGLPIEEVFIPKASSNEEYESKMKVVLTKFKQAGVSSVVYGDVFLEWIRKYREDNLSQLAMKGIFPIWGRDTAELTRSFIALGFQAVITCIDSKVLDRRFIGRRLDEHFLVELPPNVDPGGENGEFHSFVFDGPIFKERIAYSLGELVLRDSFYFCDLISKIGGQVDKESD
ncbi:MAG: diphthine--ammonia ligase [Dehalococcoidales bacterium]